MLDAIKDAWHSAVTEGDNATHCPVRLGAVGTAIVYHLAAAWAVLHDVHLDMTALGLYVNHMVTLIGVSAAGIGVKSVLKGDAQ